jgi:hypothetical protein
MFRDPAKFTVARDEKVKRELAQRNNGRAHAAGSEAYLKSKRNCSGQSLARSDALRHV